LLGAVAVAAGIAVLCVALALSIARTIPAPEPGAGLTALPRSAHLKLQGNEVPNRAKKAAREAVKQARLVPNPSRLGAERQAPQDEDKAAREASAQLAANLPPEIVTPKPEIVTPLPEEADGDHEDATPETGRASWYDLPTKTASGEPMDGGALTAAHRTLPLGTKVRVANLDNGRAVVVRINDRGPFAKNRLIDLSRAAAERLGMIADGVANVRVSPVAGEVASNAASR
jgi:rare lipoprotein A